MDCVRSTQEIIGIPKGTTGTIVERSRPFPNSLVVVRFDGDGRKIVLGSWGSIEPNPSEACIKCEKRFECFTMM